MKNIFISLIALFVISSSLVTNVNGAKIKDSKYILVLKNATKKFIPVNIKYKDEWNDLFYNKKIPSKDSNIAKFVAMGKKSKSLKIIKENYLKIKNHKGKLARRNPYNYQYSVRDVKGVMTFVYYYKIMMAQNAINNEWDEFLDNFDRYIYFSSVFSSTSFIQPSNLQELYYLFQKIPVPDYVFDQINDKINGLIKCYKEIYLDKELFIITFNYYREIQILNLSVKYKNKHGKWPTTFDTKEIATLFKTLSSSPIKYEITMNNIDIFKNQFEFGFLLKISKKGLETQYQGICLNPVKIIDKESVKRSYYKDLWITNISASESILTNPNYQKYFSFIKKLKFEKIN